MTQLLRPQRFRAQQRLYTAAKYDVASLQILRPLPSPIPHSTRHHTREIIGLEAPSIQSRSPVPG